jgi:hypothetical protein
MPKISSYTTDNNVTANDSWIGSDGDNSLVTKNFTPGGIATYIANAGLIDVDKRHVYSQITAESVWAIPHNLAKYPSVTIIDSNGFTVVGDINYVNVNNVTLTFSESFSGVAYLN